MSPSWARSSSRLALSLPWAPAQRAEKMPGAPPSTSTQRPLSSATAGWPVARARAWALRSAFSAKVTPVSLTSGTSGYASAPTRSWVRPASARIAWSSVIFPALRVARIRRVMRRLSPPGQGVQTLPVSVAASVTGVMSGVASPLSMESRTLVTPAWRSSTALLRSALSVVSPRSLSSLSIWSRDSDAWVGSSEAVDTACWRLPTLVAMASAVRTQSRALSTAPQPTAAVRVSRVAVTASAVRWWRREAMVRSLPGGGYVDGRTVRPVRPYPLRRRALRIWLLLYLSLLAECAGERLFLELGEVGAAGGGEVEEGVELVAVEGLGLGGALDLDEAAVAGADDVHVGLGADVLLVAEVEEGGAVDDADADRGDGAGEGLAAVLDDLLALGPGDGVGEGDVGTGDGGGAGASVGLEDVAVEDDGVLAEGLVVDDGAERAADETADLVGAPADLAAYGFAVAAGVGRAGQHGVLGGDPALAAALAPTRDAFGDGGGAEDLGVAEGDEYGAFGVLAPSAFDGDGAELFGGAAVDTRHGVDFIGCVGGARPGARQAPSGGGRG